MNRLATLACGLAFAAFALSAPLSAQASPISAISASWSTTQLPCTDCAVSPTVDGVQIDSTTAVTALVVDAELSNVIDGWFTNVLQVYNGNDLLGSIDFASIAFDPSELAPGVADFANTVTNRLFINYDYLRSGYLSISAGGDSFNRVRIVGQDSVRVLDAATGQYIDQFSDPGPNVGQLPEPGGMTLVLASLGALLLARRRVR